MKALTGWIVCLLRREHPWHVRDVGRFKVRTCRRCGRVERKRGRWRWRPYFVRWLEDERPPEQRASSKVRQHWASGRRR